MSSFVGHSLTGIGLYVLSQSERKNSLRTGGPWLLWLIVVAVAPDLDYVVPAFSPLSHAGLRITHSIAFSLILAILSGFALAWSQCLPGEKWGRSLQVVGVGLSHIGMDLLVGVTALPLLWPLSNRLFGLPFGILPSAPAIRLNNYFLYRNILIEIGILLPFYVSLCLARRTNLVKLKRCPVLLGLCVCWIGFAYWGYTLAR